jgi:uncharacterized membrane protein YkvA (DUF1232 family)
VTDARVRVTHARHTLWSSQNERVTDGWAIAIGVAGGLVLLWAALLVALWLQVRRAGGTADWREAVRLVPDVIRLLRRLVADRTVPRTVRWSLIALLAYLLSPIDLVPDFVPLLGYADDAIAVAFVLRFAIARAGVERIEQHWPGTPTGLAGLLRVVGVARA